MERDAVASWLVRWIPERAVRVRALLGTLCCVLGQDTCSHSTSLCPGVSGAIIGDGDRRRAPFLVLGLAPLYGRIFYWFLEHIALSPVAHARTCCEDFRGWRAGKMASEIPEIVLCFSVLVHNSTLLLLLEFCLSIFVVSCSSLTEDSAEFRYVPLYIADQVVFHYFFYKNFTLLHSKFHICKRLTPFHNTAKS